MAYTEWFGEVRRRIDIETQVAVFARAMGNDVPIPDLEEMRRRFDTLLAEDPFAGAGMGDIPTERLAILREAFGTHVK